MNTATISLHRKNALIKFRELKNLVSIMKRTITLLSKVLVTSSLTEIKGSTYALSGLAAAINPATVIGLYTQTIVLYIATYLVWRLISEATSSILSAPGIDMKNTIVLINLLGLEIRLPLKRCTTFEASLCHMCYTSGAH
jgi:hypothetical protein